MNAAFPPHQPPPLNEKRNVLVLSLAQALHVSGVSISVSVSPIAGAALAPHPSLAALPHAIQFLALTAASLPAAKLMQQLGRRFGFSLGAALAVIAGCVACIAVLSQHFITLCVATAIFGAATAFAQQYRFAAPEAASPKFRGRAVSYTLLGGVLAAWLGPQIAKSSFDALPQLFAGPYLAWSALGIASLILLQFLKIPHVRPQKTTTPPPPLPLSAPFIIAVACGCLAYFSMAFIMTATPLSMNAELHPFHSSTSVIQWHVVAMFAPAFLSGPLIDRFGPVPVIYVGAALLAVVTPLAFTEPVATRYFLALIALGVAWNFLFTSASVSIAQISTPETKGSIQGVNDVLVFSSAALATFLAGPVLHLFGWRTVSSIAFFCAAGAAVCAVLLAASRKRARLAAP